MKKFIDFIIKVSPILVLSFLTIGYATFSRNFELNGIVNLKKVGKVEIINPISVDDTQTKTLTNYGTISVDETTGTILLDFDFQLSGSNQEKTYSATYLVTIVNNSPFNYTYTGFNINPNVTLSNSNNGGAEVSYSLATNNKNNTLTPGSILAPGKTGVVAVKLDIKVGSKSSIHISVDGSGSVDSDLNNEGELNVALDKTEVNIRGENTIDCFNVDAINTYNYSRNLMFSSSNTNFTLINEDGTALDVLTIGAPDENDSTSNNKTFKICIKESEGAIFLNDTAQTSIVVSSGSITNMQVGNLNVLVDKYTEEIKDTVPPSISIKSFNRVKYDTSENTLTLAASWERTDTGGTDIMNYYVELYDAENDNLLGSYETGSSVTNLNITLDSSFLSKYNTQINTDKHDFYVLIYGEDAVPNSGKSYCSDLSTDYCVKSDTTKLQYQFTVNTSGDYTTFGSNKTAYYGNDYSTTVTPSSTSYNLPGSITVNVTGQSDALKVNDDYTYSSKDGTIKVYAKNIVNNISIDVDSTYGGNICLVKGTKIKLANGSYKNIEDIKYDDLLAVYSHEQGRVVYEYPVWIETEGHTSEYQRTYFSDGSYLDTFSSHGIFSMDSLKYVSVLDNYDFHEGTRVVKIDENNRIKIVTVVKQEIIKEKTTYYHVSSVRYHNIIANDLLTTDAVLEVSNMYTFNKDITWGIDREIFLKTKKLWDNANLPQFPVHIFKGFRGEEIKFLYDQNKINLPLYTRLLNGGMVTPYQDKDGNNLWIIKTSDSDAKFYKEGTNYIVPQPKNRKGVFVGWYNTGDNKYYKPGESFVVNYSMYLEAVYK